MVDITSPGNSWGDLDCLESLHGLTIAGTGLWRVEDPSNAALACLPIPWHQMHGPYQTCKLA